MPSVPFFRVLLAAAFAACLVVAESTSPAFARDTTPDAPAIWKIDGPQGDVYLFGSVHLLPKDVNWRTPALDAALNEAKVVVFEIDLDKAKDPAATKDLIVNLGLLPQGTTLRQLLAPERRAKLERVTASIGLQAAALDPLRPWLAAITVGVQWIVSKGFDPSSGVDQQVWNWTKENGKERATLETIEDQLNVFAGLTREQEIEYLVVSLDQIETAPDMLNDMITAWRKGNLKALDKILNDGTKDIPVLNERMMIGRHVKWLPQIEKMMADGRTHVIVVGAAHLAGKDSVITMLRAKGVKVEGP
ncbi:MAG: TraB/GumN family protein [Alphaproteobacteria bacterium]|nr:TraB/GumN family protein [Alphaproteobacteria bacterium]